MSESRQRYRHAMQSSAHFDPVAAVANPVHRRRTRTSMFLSGSRIDPSSFIRPVTAPSPNHHVPAHKTSFEHSSTGEVVAKENASLKPRRTSLIEPPRAPPGQEEIQPRMGKRVSMIEVEAPLSDGNQANSVISLRSSDGLSLKNDSFLSLTSNSLMKVQAGNVSQCIASLLSPEKVADGSIRRSGRLSSQQLEETLSPNVRTHIKCNVVANRANHMEATNIVPARKQSRWSRKKSLEAGKAAFLAMTKPKSYGFSKPPVEEPPKLTGNGVTGTHHHRKNFAMVVHPRQAVNPPWGTDAN